VDPQTLAMITAMGGSATQGGQQNIPPQLLAPQFGGGGIFPGGSPSPAPNYNMTGSGASGPSFSSPNWSQLSQMFQNMQGGASAPAPANPTPGVQAPNVQGSPASGTPAQQVVGMSNSMGMPGFGVTAQPQGQQANMLQGLMGPSTVQAGW
jgi:hypothetical protein